MANIKISELPVASTPLTGAEELPVVQLGNTVKATVNNLTTFLPVATLQQVLNNNHNLLDAINLQGTGAGSGNSGKNINGLGANAAASNTGDLINALGTQAAQSNHGLYVNALGYQAAQNNTANSVNALGNQAAKGNTGTNVNALGYQAGLNNTYSDVTLLGYGATADDNMQLVLASYSTANQARIYFGNISDNRNYELPDASGTIALTADIIPSTLQQVTTGINKNLINGINLQGTGAGATNSGTNINALGTNAASTNTKSDINALGNSAANNNTSDNVNALGNNAAISNSGEGNVNALGLSSGEHNSGSDVNFLGRLSGSYNTGNSINGLGYQAAKSNTGSNVNAIGYQAGVSNSFSHVTLLGKSATANATSQLVLSNGSNNARISYINLTASRTYELPDTSGTFTLTSGIGVSGFMTRWTSATSVGASTLLSDNANTISIGNSSPSASARLQVDSTTSGFLPPRMNTAQRNAIFSPAEGLCVYDTTLHKLYVYDGTTWQACW